MDKFNIDFRIELGVYDPQISNTEDKFALDTVVDANTEFKLSTEELTGFSSPADSFGLCTIPKKDQGLDRDTGRNDLWELNPLLLQIEAIRNTELGAGAASLVRPIMDLSTLPRVHAMTMRRGSAFRSRESLASERCGGDGGEDDCSGAADTASTVSDVSGYEEEMFRIRRLLLEEDAGRSAGGKRGCALCGTQMEELRAQLELREAEATRSAQAAATAESEAQLLRVRVQQAAVEAEARQAAVQALKQKVAELHADLQAQQQERFRAESGLSSCRLELGAAHRQAEWYRDQLHTCQANKAKLHQQLLNSEQAALMQNHEVERLRVELDRAGARESAAKEAGMRDKERLVRRLEAIQADMLALSSAPAPVPSPLPEPLLPRASDAEHEELEEKATRLERALAEALDAASAARDSEARVRGFAESAQKAAAEREAAACAAEARAQLAEASRVDAESVLRARESALQEERSRGAEARAALEAATREKAEVGAAVARLRDDFARISQRYGEMKERLLEGERRAREELRVAREECQALRERAEGAEVKVPVVEELPADVLRLRDRLRESEAERKKNERRYERNVRMLLRKVKEHLRGRRAAEQALQWRVYELADGNASTGEKAPKEKALLTDRALRKQLFLEKCETAQLRRQLTVLHAELATANRVLEQRGLELCDARLWGEAGHERAADAFLALEGARRALDEQRHESSLLRVDLIDAAAKDPLLAEQIKMLDAQVEEHRAEAAAAKKHLHIAEEQWRVKEQCLEEMILQLESEKNKLREQVAELNATLSTVSSGSSTIGGSVLPDLMSSLPAVPGCGTEGQIVMLLKRNNHLPQRRPLSNLQKCLLSLKQEVHSLQVQLTAGSTDVLPSPTPLP